MNKLLISFFLIVSGLQACSPTSKTEPIRPNAIQLILKNDCLNCHSIEDRLVGPPYLDISKKYKDVYGIQKQLTHKIKEGGGGLWYGGVMSSHPFLKPEEIRAMVNWILSISDQRDHFIDSSVNHRYTEILDKKEGLFQLEVFISDRLVKNFNHINENHPVYSGYIDQISMMGDESFTGIEDHAVLKYSGKLHLKHTGKYMFRLQKTGIGQLNIDGDEIISTRPDDMELTRRMKEGLHTFEVLYQPTHKKDTLVLSYIAPDMSFYELVSP